MSRKFHTRLFGQFLGLALLMALGVTSLFAAKGDGDDKNKKGYVLRFNGFEVRSNYLSPLSMMQQGATYKGTLSPMQNGHASDKNPHSIITYQKGNTIYIYPLQQKGFIQKFKTPSKDN